MLPDEEAEDSYKIERSDVKYNMGWTCHGEVAEGTFPLVCTKGLTLRPVYVDRHNRQRIVLDLEPIFSDQARLTLQSVWPCLFLVVWLCFFSGSQKEHHNFLRSKQRDTDVLHKTGLSTMRFILAEVFPLVLPPDLQPRPRGPSAEKARGKGARGSLWRPLLERASRN